MRSCPVTTELSPSNKPCLIYKELKLVDCYDRGFLNTRVLKRPGQQEDHFLDLSSNNIDRIPESYFTIIKVIDLCQNPFCATGRSFKNLLCENSTENLTSIPLVIYQNPTNEHDLETDEEETPLHG